MLLLIHNMFYYEGLHLHFYQDLLKPQYIHNHSGSSVSFFSDLKDGEDPGRPQVMVMPRSTPTLGRTVSEHLQMHFLWHDGRSASHTHGILHNSQQAHVFTNVLY